MEFQPTGDIRWLHQLIEAAPDDAPAVIDYDKTEYSYGDLRRIVAALAGMLREHGVRPGDRVMLVAENCMGFAAAVFALSHLQAWVLPINARQTETELRAVQAHSGARCMLFTPDASDPAADHALRFDAQARFELECGLLLASAPVEAMPEPVEEDSAERVAAMLYTTGTTSAPKGVMLTHANLTWNAQRSAEFRSMRSDDLVLAVLPGSHIFGFASTMLATFYRGACLRFLSRFAPPDMLRAFAEGASMLPAVPQMYERILTHLDKTGEVLDAPRLRYISAGGAPLDPDLKARAEAVFGQPLNNGYGITETSPTIAVTRPWAPVSDMSCGPALSHVTVRVDAPNDEGIGELIIEGPGVMKGYYRDPEASVAALPQRGVFRSGDLGRVDEAGNVHVVGRLKELIIRSGFNVYPPEVEAMLTRHEDVLQASVVPRKQGSNEEILAFVMVRGGLSHRDLAAWLRPRLAPYKLPQFIVVVDAFPIAATGKVLKHKLIGHFADQLAALEAETQSKDAT